jgi:predicted DNA-binding transcriptional regulator YafY
MKTARRDALLGLLSQAGSWTATALAERLGVSLRSVRRDLAQLREEGVVLDAEPGCGGGVRLGRRSNLPRLQLSHREAMTLLMGLTSAETLGALLGQLASDAVRDAWASSARLALFHSVCQTQAKPA